MDLTPADVLRIQTRCVDSSYLSSHNAPMAKALDSPQVKLICGMISADTALFDEAEVKLRHFFGPVDHVSEIMDFDLTDYYAQQMGRPLFRRFVAFQELVAADQLCEAKWQTNKLEEQFSGRVTGVPRPINLDPGYIEESKLVLASMKNFSHRIYLGRGVYAEITLLFRKGAWEALPWTFPDYASRRYDAFLTHARNRLRQQKSPQKREERT